MFGLQATKNKDQLPVSDQLSPSLEEVRPIKEEQAANTEPASSLFFDAGKLPVAISIISRCFRVTEQCLISQINFRQLK